MLRRWAEQRIETGAFRGTLPRALAAWWRRTSNPRRPVQLPTGVAVIGIGGATLGGSGKTPVTLSLARLLAERSSLRSSGGASVAVVATSYGGRLTRPRVIVPDDAARVVGDEALMLARALHAHGVVTVAGARRNAALALAASLAPVVLVDGLLQSRPQRLHRSLLVLDALEPWGSGDCPPAGNLRASVSRLLGAADVVLSCRDPLEATVQSPRELVGFGGAVLEARSELGGALTPDGRRVSVERLGELRLGLALAIARPDRVLRALELRGIVPAQTEFSADHSVPTPRTWGVTRRARGSGQGLRAWLATAKCATKLGQIYRGAPVWTLDHRVCLPDRLVRLCTVSLISGDGANPW